MRNSSLTFYIDTSSSDLIVGLIEDETLIAEIQENLGKNLSTNTLFLIEKMFNDCGIDVNDIDKIIVVNGPGSFTGIRIGITIAKTYAWALKKKITTISSLEAMSVSTNTESYKIPYIDARRGYVFAGIYNQNNEVVLENQYIKFDALLEKANALNSTYVLISNDKLSEHQNQVKYKANILSIVKYSKNKETINPHAVNPIYLKKTEAEESKGINAE